MVLLSNACVKIERETRTEKAYRKGKFFGAIKWPPLIPGCSSATERYPNFLLSYFLRLAQRPRIYNSGAHAAFPLASGSVFLLKCLDVFFMQLP